MPFPALPITCSRTDTSHSSYSQRQIGKHRESFSCARAIPSGKGKTAMETRTFGNTGMQVGALGLGAAEIGFEHTDDHTVDTLLGMALDLGLNVIDTAAMYARVSKLIQGYGHQ